MNQFLLNIKRGEMETEKKYVAGWWFWILLLLIISGMIITAISYGGFFTKTIVERKVFENSYQYSEARKQEIATFEAQIAEINRKLIDANLDQTTRTNLEASASAIRIQLSRARSTQ